MAAQTKDADLRTFLPGPDELPGWERDGEPQHFKGEDLFTYINGGAEVYLEYGFRQVIVQDFRANSGGRFSLEIFQMTSPESAYGMYTFKTSRSGVPVSLGDDCQLADYYLNLRKGPFLVTVTGLDAMDASEKMLLFLARTVEARLGPSTSCPDLVARLPAEGLEAQSIKYFKGALALYNSYPFFRHDVFAFSAGIKGEYAQGYSLYIFKYPDEPSARHKFAEAGRNFEQDGKYKDYAERRGLFQVNDDRDNSIFVTVRGGYVLLLVGKETEKSARKIFLLVTRKLPMPHSSFRNGKIETGSPLEDG